MESPSYVQALKSQGVDFTYVPRLDLNAIDVQAGLRNQARLEEPIDEELIEQYTIMSKSGSEAPAIVVYKRRNRNSWVPIDGNQRVATARRLHKSTIDAYVVNTEDQMVIDRLTWVFNNLVNGKRLSRDESIEHAVTMVQKYGMDIKQAAKEWGIPQRAVSKRIITGKLRDILRSRGASSLCNLTDDKLEELNSFIKLGEEVFVEAAKITHRCGLVKADIEEMKRDVDDAKTHAEKVKAVVAFGESPTAKQRRAETKGGTVKPKQYGNSPSEELYRAMKKVERLINTYDKAALRRKGVNFKETFELAKIVTDNLITIFGLGARLNATSNGAEAVAQPANTEV